MTTKKQYEKPSMKVYPLRQKPKLLQMSASIENYQDGEFNWSNS